MADATPGAPAAGAAPALTLDELNASIAASVQKGIASGLSQVRADEQARAQQGAAAAAAGKPDALRDVLSPYIDPKLNQVLLGSASAMDYTKFYVTHPEAVKHQALIEAKFAQHLQAGAPLPREQVFHMVKGERFDEFVVEHQETQKQAAARAAAAGTVGAGSGPHQVTFEDPFAMTPEALDAAMNRPGVTF